MSSGSGRFVSPISGIPYSNPLPSGGYPAMPSYPFGNPGSPFLSTPDNQLPDPGLYNTIPNPGVPDAPRRPTTEGVKMFPPISGGFVTGDPKK